MPFAPLFFPSQGGENMLSKNTLLASCLRPILLTLYVFKFQGKIVIHLVDIMVSW